MKDKVKRINRYSTLIGLQPAIEAVIGKSTEKQANFISACKSKGAVIDADRQKIIIKEKEIATGINKTKCVGCGRVTDKMFCSDWCRILAVRKNKDTAAIYDFICKNIQVESDGLVPIPPKEQYDIVGKLSDYGVITFEILENNKMKIRRKL